MLWCRGVGMKLRQGRSSANIIVIQNSGVVCRDTNSGSAWPVFWRNRTFEQIMAPKTAYNIYNICTSTKGRLARGTG